MQAQPLSCPAKKAAEACPCPAAKHTQLQALQLHSSDYVAPSVKAMRASHAVLMQQRTCNMLITDGSVVAPWAQSAHDNLPGPNSFSVLCTSHLSDQYPAYPLRYFCMYTLQSRSPIVLSNTHHSLSPEWYPMSMLQPQYINCTRPTEHDLMLQSPGHHFLYRTVV
jgi:hypothetical protein